MEEADDVQYAKIDFSVLKRRSRREAKKKRENTDTEYAEIKSNIKEEDDDGEEGEKLEVKEEEELMDGNENTQGSVQDVKEEADMAESSTVKDLTDEI